MKNIRIYRCEDSVAGIFTAIYDAWASHYGHDFIKLEVLMEDGCINMELFSDYIMVETDMEKSEKVAGSIRSKISTEVYEMVVKAALSNDPRKADCIYHFLVRGFAMGNRVISHLTDSYVGTMFEINRNVGNEVHLYLGFLRFHELDNHLLVAKFEPKNNVVELVTPHFADRLSGENFVILDVKRKLASIHQKNSPWVMATLNENEMNLLLSDTEEEEEYQNLWKAFFQSITIAERENYVCQRSHAPIHFRKYMLEFENKESK